MFVVGIHKVAGLAWAFLATRCTNCKTGRKYDGLHLLGLLILCPTVLINHIACKGGINRTKAIQAEIAAVRIRQEGFVRIEGYQLGMGNVLEKHGSVAKEIIFLAAEKKS